MSNRRAKPDLPLSASDHRADRLPLVPRILLGLAACIGVAIVVEPTLWAVGLLFSS